MDVRSPKPCYASEFCSGERCYGKRRTNPQIGRVAVNTAIKNATHSLEADNLGGWETTQPAPPAGAARWIFTCPLLYLCTRSRRGKMNQREGCGAGV